MKFDKKRAKQFSFGVSMLACLAAIWILHKLFLFPLASIMMFAGMLLVFLIVLVAGAAVVGFIISRVANSNSVNQDSDEWRE